MLETPEKLKLGPSLLLVATPVPCLVVSHLWKASLQFTAPWHWLFRNSLET